VGFLYNLEGDDMTRKEAIQHIEALYPPDSEYEDTAAIGEAFIEKAKTMCNDWRNLPDNVLKLAASMMIEEENRIGRR
jgi:hypothetical protein